MIISPFQVYLIFQADSIWIASYIIATLLFACIVLFAIDETNKEMLTQMKNNEEKINAFGGVEKPSDKNTAKKDSRGWRTVCLLILIFMSIGFFMPSTKTCIAMYAVPKIVNNKSLQKLPESMLKYINNYITENKR